MHTIRLDTHSDFWDWQPLARDQLMHNVHPDHLLFQCGHQDDLFGENPAQPQALVTPGAAAIKIPRQFIEVARFAASHRDEDRFNLLYRLLWRIHRGERSLMLDHSDTLVRRVQQLAQQCGRDYHKMKAFVRFKEIKTKAVDAAMAEPELTQPDTFYLAWFEPEHYILRLVSAFFKKRFHGMNWSILTPYQSLHWWQGELTFAQGADRDQVPQSDEFDHAWRLYYASIFNPARLKVKAMCSEMPKKYWANLPEAELIQPLIDTSQRRTQAMLNKPLNANPQLPANTRFNREQWLTFKHPERQQYIDPSPEY